MNKTEIINDIKGFLNGSNEDLKYIVNVETNPNNNIAECVIHKPNESPRIENIEYEPFLYMKDLSLLKKELYFGYSDIEIDSFKQKYGIKITKLKTGNQKRLVNGYCYKVTSTISFNAIISYLRAGGFNPYNKLMDEDGSIIYDKRDRVVQPNRDLFFNVRTTEQFFISKKTRLFKGLEEYKDVHKVTFDIETTGLRYEITRVFTIGIRDNRGFEVVLEVDKIDDDASEIKLIKEFFETIIKLKPAIVCGYFSEGFDFDFVLGRARLLNLDINTITTTLKQGYTINRRPNVSLKFGGKTERFTATEMWGVSVIDIIHSVKKAAETNSDIMGTGLKYISKFEGIAKPNRTYIEGEENTIGRYYYENKMFLTSETNEYIQIPEVYQTIATRLYNTQINKENVTDTEYKKNVFEIYGENSKFVDWVRVNALPKKMDKYISGRELVKQYLLDDLWETEQVDELHNQSSFLTAKIVPTTYQRITTMGTAAIWNLLLTAWSYDNDLAIPISDVREKFSGGLARTFIVGFVKKGKKLDFASLYPMIQLTYGVFPIFDITGVMMRMLMYLTTTRNIYKKLANYDKLNGEEIELLREIDHEVYVKYVDGTITHTDRAMFKIKQLPIKILNNSLFGALGSNIAFNWSDNVCASRITCIGRVQLRHAIHWFNQFGCTPLLAVTDGINFHIPDKTKYRVTNDIICEGDEEGLIEDMWEYNDKVGIDALIEKFNTEEMEGYMSVDDDGEFESCLNLSKINYATYSRVKDKKTGELVDKIKLTGNSIKSKVMSEYIEDFIEEGFKLVLRGKGKEFVKYYYNYVDLVYNMEIPIKKIATKKRYLQNIQSYVNRGLDKNGRPKAKQAHMELVINERKSIATELFEKHKDEFDLTSFKGELTIDDKMRLVEVYMPPEPVLDSMIYYYNIGTKKSHGDSKLISNMDTGEPEIACKLINKNDLIDNPEITKRFNHLKYIDALNKKVVPLLSGFNPDIRKKILVKINKKDELVKSTFKDDDLILRNFEHNNLGESMYLEDLEVDFWNKNGYDPRLIWEGFKMNDDYKIIYEIYENALSYVNKIKTTLNEPKIKSINDKLVDGDYVLIKDKDIFNIGMFNGVYIQIIENNVYVPKTMYDEELETMRFNRYNKYSAKELVKRIIDEDDMFAKKKFVELVFVEFKLEHEISENITIELLFDINENAKAVFTEYYVDKLREYDENLDEENIDELID